MSAYLIRKYTCYVIGTRGMKDSITMLEKLPNLENAEMGQE